MGVSVNSLQCAQVLGTVTIGKEHGKGRAGAVALNEAMRRQWTRLPRPARNERGEGWGEGKSEPKRPSSPRPSPPAAGGEGEASALSDFKFLTVRNLINPTSRKG